MTEKHDKPFTSINHWAEDERPRERLINVGEKSLTIAELFAILIGSGTVEKSAVDLMKDIITDAGGTITGVQNMDIEQLMAYKGIGMAKAITIKAAAELARRRAGEDVSQKKNLQHARDIYEFMRPRARDLNHECAWAIMLNNQMKLNKVYQISEGGMTEAIVDVRQVMKKAIISDTVNIVLVHNHPSGNVTPSKMDNMLTEKMATAARTLNMRLVDHVIVTDGDYYSYAEQGRI